MAGNFLQFSVVVPMETSKEIAWWERFREDGICLNAAGKVFKSDGQPVTADEDAVEFCAVVSCDRNDVEDGEVFIYVEESGNVDATAVVIQRYLEECGRDDIIRLSWALTCSKLLPGEFGGGECLISRLRIAFAPLWKWHNRTEAQMQKRLAAKPVVTKPAEVGA